MADHHAQGLEPTNEELEMAGLLLESLMFPSVPSTAAEEAAVRRATWLQAVHTRTYASQTPDLPADVESFQIGHFRMQYRGGRKSQDICPAARALLLKEGLLYKGVERRRTPVQIMPQRLPVRDTRPVSPTKIRAGQRGPLQRDSWKTPEKPRPQGNPPPQGIPPQGEPPIPGFPTYRAGARQDVPAGNKGRGRKP
ncbi:MAG: hypothetical protein J6N77_05455 [Lachnospiraceae bacterium]|nr:hypothetical protein [Lachnospiraceae bacterium]